MNAGLALWLGMVVSIFLVMVVAARASRAAERAYARGFADGLDIRSPIPSKVHW